ncbi:MAG: hypothetical protein NVSMB1_12540 [Polyangiales bacterium]
MFVMRMVSDLWRRGCLVHIKATDPDIHTSGHAHRDEQRRMIDLVMPSAFVPVHGTRHHLERHAAIAREASVTKVLVLENGEIADLESSSGGSVSTMDKVGVTHVGKVAVQDRLAIADSVLRERAILGEIGFAAAVVEVDPRGRPTHEPVVVTRGVISEHAEEAVLADAQREVEVAVASHPFTQENPSDEEIRGVARLAVRRALARHVGQKPLGLAVIIRHRR